MFNRRAMLGLLASASAVAVRDHAWGSLPSGQRTQFGRMKLGGGGYVTDIDVSPDGTTRVIKTDVFGCYIWDDVTAQWEQLVTKKSMPMAERLAASFGSGFGCYAIRVAPSLPTR